MERLDHELQQRSHLSMTDFEILSALDEAPGKKIRMSELAQKVLVSRSRLTYRVDRLVQAKYLEREECTDDRRGLWAILTETGAQALQAATPGHIMDIENWFFNHLDPEEIQSLGRVMTRIEDKLRSNR